MSTARPQPGDDEPGIRAAEEEPPPIGGSWLVLYLAVLVNLAVLILLFYAFTRAFS